MRGGIMSIDIGQTEGANSIGMNHFKTMLYVILPHTIRNIIPQIGNNLIINIKDTSVMFVIGYAELFAAHKAIVGAKYIDLPVGSHNPHHSPYYDGHLLAYFKALGKENGRTLPTSTLPLEDTLALTSGTYSYVKKSERSGK